jgi:hypothetical protein
LLTIGVSEDQAEGLVKAAEPVVAGAVLYGATQAWSVIEKKKRR